MNLYETKSELEKYAPKRYIKQTKKVVSLAGFEPTPYTAVLQEVFYQLGCLSCG